MTQNPLSPLTSAPVSADAAVHLRAEGISHAYGTRRVLTDVSLVVPAGTPTGLLGENGSGKSTLLRVLAGVEQPDSGSVDVPGPVGLLWQELPFSLEATVADVLDDALERSRRLERELEAAGEDLATAPEDPAVLRRYDELLTAATLADVWDAPRRAVRVLGGLGLTAVPRDRPIGRVSGGQRRRLALAHLLIARPTTLLLDEPTNHVDDAGAEFLARLLAEHPGPVLVASHDRTFLDEATKAQLDLDEAPTALEAGGLVAYTGTFSDYLLARMDARERWEKQYRDEQEELDRLRGAVRDNHTVGHPGRPPRTEGGMAKKFYADRNAAVVSRRVRDAERRLEELERTQVRKPPHELQLSALPPAIGGTCADVVLSATDVGVRGRLAPVSFALTRGQKLLVTGPNGSGKSTLMAVLAGELPPDEGRVNGIRPDRIGHLVQDEHLDPDLQVRAHLLVAAADGEDVEDPRAMPELFGLVHPRDLDRRIGELSRGQQRRVALAALLSRRVEVLLLDEPTNHLALDVATRLEAAVVRWNGTVVIASHDRWLRRRWNGESLELGEDAVDDTGGSTTPR
jgi:macrolide transport system ATP-binding/permease protein